MYNFISKSINQCENQKKLKENYIKIIYLLLPVLPHFSMQCLEELRDSDKKEWPKVDPKYLKSDSIQIVVQVNGKKRTTIDGYEGIGEPEVVSLLEKTEYYEKKIKGNKIQKTIYVKNRLINLII